MMTIRGRATRRVTRKKAIRGGATKRAASRWRREKRGGRSVSTGGGTMMVIRRGTSAFGSHRDGKLMVAVFYINGRDGCGDRVDRGSNKRTEERPSGGDRGRGVTGSSVSERTRRHERGLNSGKGGGTGPRKGNTAEGSGGTRERCGKREGPTREGS